ncbi:MAG: hypothetical protein KatS3mg019_1924 [Fimbriimonadales bacterium]|nr:MAG: hypothetical protein KatS3mg019_1924 [Fimbriimonadales bacterium]
MITTIGLRKIAGVASAAALSGAIASATIIEFNHFTSNGATIPTDYASRVDASGNDVGGRTGFDLTYDPTPNVAVQMFSADYQGGSWNQIGSLNWWSTQYANLSGIAYHSPSNQGARFIFTADTGYWVRLHQFQMGSWPNVNRTLPFLQVVVDGTPVYTQNNVVISGSTANTFSFDPDVVKGGVIEIRFGGDWNVGIDNIGFSQAIVPEPASWLVLGAGLAGLMRLRRRD